jgi:tRNA threonylcarbamoyl adenosine modification protein (Sua5/YciO/YrdC/YwlC family)
MAQYFVIHPVNPQTRLVRQASEIVRAGGVIAYPTDSSYALGCRLGDADAVRRVRAIRQVDEKHNLALVCRNLVEIGRYAIVHNRQFRILKMGTPGPYTFLMRATREVPRRLQHPKRSTIGLRVPDHRIVQALLTELDEPLLSTTLILPGDDVPLNDANNIRQRLEAVLDLIIDGGPCPREPTTVIDLAVDPPRVERQGRGDLRRLGLGAGRT